jgi:hypothetical protein
MLLVDLFGWWYSRGWAWAISELFVKRTESIASFFSISELLRTLLAPFRQDAVNVSGAPISVRLQVFGGNIISRIFGLIIRLTLVLVGALVLLANFIASCIAAVAWPFIPLSPVVSIVLLAMGVGK